jgi:uncharacterized protein
MDGTTEMMRQRRGDLTLYLAVAFGGGWAAQLGVLALVRLLELPSRLLPLLLLGAAPLLMWPPAIGALLVRARARRAGGDVELGVRWPPGLWRWLLAAWAGTVLLVLLTALFSLPFNPFDAEFTPMREAFEASGQPMPASAGFMLAAQLALALVLAPFINSIFALGEELGWRGFLAPALVARMGLVRGVLLHGAIWGVWHAPLIGLGGHNYPQHPLPGIFLFIAFCTGYGTFLAWLRQGSRSVWPATLAHATLNAVGGIPLLVLTGVDAGVSGVAWSPVGLVLLALLTPFLLMRMGTRASEPRAAVAGARDGPREGVKGLDTRHSNAAGLGMDG